MPLPQPNFGYFTYVSADGTSYNIRAGAEWAAIAEHGLAARVTGQPRYTSGGSRKPRHVIYKDLTTGRSKSGPIGTSAAFDAIDIGDTHDFPVHGQAGLVTYTVVAKVGERVPGTVLQGFLADHA